MSRARSVENSAAHPVTSSHRPPGGSGATSGAWRVPASDKHRRCYPVLDLDLREVGRLEAFYPTNIPWPTLAALEGQSLLVGFNGAPYGGRLVGYGSHGEVVLQRASRTP